MKKVIITCDTEVGELGLNKRDAFEVFIEGKVNGEIVGYKLINQLASKYGAKVCHFVDIYPYHKFGEKKFKELCENILEDGHELGLHTHPSGKYDKQRKFMWQYSLDEQMKIVEFGVKKIKEWTGLDMYVHRAGGYGANNDTLIALKENGIEVDSSFFYGNSNCKLEFGFINKINKINGILEVPVTVFKKRINYLPLLVNREFFAKLDFRYGSTADEIVDVIKKMPDDSVIILFLHSFNFLNLPYNFKTRKYGRISVNRKLICEYERLLEYIQKAENIMFTTFESVMKYYDKKDSKGFEDCYAVLHKRESFVKPIWSKIKFKLGRRGNI